MMRYAPLVCAALLAACGPDAPAREQHPRWALAREAVAGAGEGEGALTDVGGVAVGRDGMLYVTQPQEHLVRMYDRTGRFLRAVGREGEGPGEFDHPGHMGWRGDTLWVQDSGNQRISFFRPDGTFVRAVAFARAAPLTDDRVQIPGYALADGSVLGFWRAFLQDIAGSRRVSVPMVRFSEAGEPLSRIGREERYRQFTEMKYATGVTYGPQPFTDSPLKDVAPDGSSIVIVTRDAATSAEPAKFSVRRMDLTGRTDLDLTLRYTPVPVREAMVDSAVARFIGSADASGAGGPPAGARERAVREALYIPRFLPPVAGLIVGRDGTIWLRREKTGAATEWWHVLDRGGRHLANVPVPAGLSVAYADAAQLWAVERDEDDVPTLVRFRVSPAR